VWVGGGGGGEEAGKGRGGGGRLFPLLLPMPVYQRGGGHVLVYVVGVTRML